MGRGCLPSFVKRCDAWAAILYSGSPTLFTNKASSTCQRKKSLVWEKITFLQWTVYTVHVHLRKTLFWSIMKALLWYLCICAKTIVPFLPLASPQAVQKICLKFNKKISDTWSINMIHYTSIWFDFIFLIYLVLFPITMIHVLVAWNITHCFLSCSHNIVFWHHL